MDKGFEKATDEFFTQRINWHRQHESDAANNAYMELRACAERLRETLTEDQRLLLRDAENAYRAADGETGDFFYRAGFADAIRFLFQFEEDAVD